MADVSRKLSDATVDSGGNSNSGSPTDASPWVSACWVLVGSLLGWGEDG